MLSLLILVPSSILSFCHTHSLPISFHLPTLILSRFSGKNACGATHGVYFPVAHSLLGSDDILYDFARDSDATVFLVISDRLYLDAFTVELVPLE